MRGVHGKDSSSFRSTMSDDEEPKKEVMDEDDQDDSDSRRNRDDDRDSGDDAAADKGKASVKAEKPEGRGGGGAGGDKACYNCGNVGHLSRDCKEAKKEGADDRACYNCGKTGHVSKACGEPRKERAVEEAPPADTSKMHTLKVDNITFETTSETLRPRFEKFGEVGDVYIPKARGSGRSRGFAFIRFMVKKDAEDAMKEMDNQVGCVAWWGVCVCAAARGACAGAVNYWGQGSDGQRRGDGDSLHEARGGWGVRLAGTMDNRAEEQTTSPRATGRWSGWPTNGMWARGYVHAWYAEEQPVAA